jgi:hypothetical protein
MIWRFLLFICIFPGIPFLFSFWRHSRKKVFKPDNLNRPFTSEELRRIGIVLPDPERYDCETFIR